MWDEGMERWPSWRKEGRALVRERSSRKVRPGSRSPERDRPRIGLTGSSLEQSSDDTAGCFGCWRSEEPGDL
jgi:hypothetical protein